VADEEVTDLNEDGSSGAGDKGKKKAKEPKAPKEPKEKKQKGPKEGKSKGGGSGGIIIIMILVLLILIGGFGAALYLDMFSAREIVAELITEPLLGIVIWLDPGYLSIEQRLQSEEEKMAKEFAERSAKLEEREANIALMESVINTREIQIERRDAEQNRREEQLLAMYERTIPLYRREFSEEMTADMNSLVRTYTNLAPDVASSILLRLYDIRDVASILWFMSERDAALILAEFTPEYAAEITEIWLYS